MPLHETHESVQEVRAGGLDKGHVIRSGDLERFTGGRSQGVEQRSTLLEGRDGVELGVNEERRDAHLRGIELIPFACAAPIHADGVSL